MGALAVPAGWTVTDLFAGAGGSSLAARSLGGELSLVVNHWPVAIETHAANFGAHAGELVVEDIALVEPQRFGRLAATDVLLASPECTAHASSRNKVREIARARGAARTAARERLERSRATMWCVPRWCELHPHGGYRLVIVENVLDVLRWPLFEPWLAAMRALGYDCELVSANAMHAGVPQSRDRLFIVCWRSDQRPDLELTARADCTRCGPVAARRVWRDHHRVGRFGHHYHFACPRCSDRLEPRCAPASATIDWDVPWPRVGERSRPLAATTRDRVASALSRWGYHVSRVDRRAISPTTHGGPQPALLMGYFSPTAFRTLDQPRSTVTTIDHWALLGLPARARSTLAATIDACRLRMCAVPELAAAMGFPPDYRLAGTQREQIKQLGNAVCPPSLAQVLSPALASL